MKRIAILITFIVLSVLVERTRATENTLPTEAIEPAALLKEQNRGSCAGVDCRKCCSENIFMGDTSQCCRCCADCMLRYGNFQCDDWPI